VIIISHRGLWSDTAEKNQRTAFLRTVERGFGTETDVRDSCGRLVIAHDPPVGDEVELAHVVSLFAGTGLPLALNVKADGLSAGIGAVMAVADVPWFAFDMSVPETVRYARAGLPFFTRHSDVEPYPVLYGPAQGVWLDAFESEWFTAETIGAHLDNDKKVCIVSSELHGRDPGVLWSLVAQFRNEERVVLCTDEPSRAKEVTGT
jgi:glycerophosphoryl diester phosphodiesterase